MVIYLAIGSNGIRSLRVGGATGSSIASPKRAASPSTVFAIVTKTSVALRVFLEIVSDQLIGHAPVSIGGRHGKGVDIETLASQVGMLKFEFVDWEPILKAA